MAGMSSWRELRTNSAKIKYKVAGPLIVKQKVVFSLTVINNSVILTTAIPRARLRMGGLGKNGCVPLQKVQYNPEVLGVLSIKDIAKLAGVSRGTVDRVLNGRGEVNAETCQKVLNIMEEVHFTPNRLGKRLAIKKKELKFGCILYGHTDENPYFAEVVNAMKIKEMELEEYGIQLEIRHTGIDEPLEVIRYMDEMKECGVNGLVISPINDMALIQKIDQLSDANIPIVTIGTDLPNSKRLAYVGSNSYAFGQTAANLLALFTEGRAQIGIVSGSEFSYNHQQKVQGFVDYLQQNYSEMQVVARSINHDRDDESYARVTEMLRRFPQLDSIYFAAGGLRGGCRAVQDAGLAGKLKIVSFDLMPFNRKMVQEGVILATIGQQPEYMAEKALDILVDYLGMNIRPTRECFYSRTEIRVKANLNM